jgi:hypothetical protein
MKFKTEVSLLLIAITLFTIAMFFYSYNISGENSTLNFNLAYPYRGMAIAFVGFGSVSMLTASVSYSKRSKNIIKQCS